MQVCFCHIQNPSFSKYIPYIQRYTERPWRWFAKKDKITLAQLKQIGVEGIVTALHDVPLGEVWTREKSHELKEYIESYVMK